MRFLVAIMFAAAVFVASPTPAVAQQSGLGTLSAQTGVNVSGTRWAGVASWYESETKEWTLYFRPDGVLEYSYEGSNYDNGRWTQNDGLLTFHTNNYFALYSGTVDNMAFRGVMHNRRGSTGTFVFTRR